MASLRCAYRAVPVGVAYLCILGGLAASACRSVGGGARLKDEGDGIQAQPAAAGGAIGGVDVNDISILFPLPKPDEPIDVLLGLDALVTHQDSPTLRANVQSATVPKQLVHEETFRQIMRTAVSQGATIGSADDPEGPVAHDYHAWRIVAARFLPCARDFDLLDQSTPGGPAAKKRRCTFENRLVAQPLKKDAQGRWVAEDIAMHLIHRPLGGNGAARTTARLALMDEMTNALRGIKQLALDELGVSTDYTPLGVHPALAKGGLKTRTADAIKKYITDFHGAAVMNNIAFMSVIDDETWTFFVQGVDTQRRPPVPELSNVALRAPNRDIVSQVLGRTPAGDTIPPDDEKAMQERFPKLAQIPRDQLVSQSFSLTDANETNRAPDRQDGFPPIQLTTGEPGAGMVATLGPLLDLQSHRQSGQPVDETVRRHALEAAFMAENPEKSELADMDCISCHNSTAHLQQERAIDGMKFPTDFQNLFVPPEGVTGYADQAVIARSPSVFRNFGYFFSQPVVSMRTVHETAQLVGWINPFQFDDPAKRFESPSPRGASCDQKKLALCMHLGPKDRCKQQLPDCKLER
jgi:hypothetical protein